jgi:tetratricopeptide (TPR) repeat protein
MSRQPWSPSATAADLNNDAALQIYTGNYSQAAETLSYALNIIQQAMGVLKSCNRPPNHKTSEPRTPSYVSCDCIFSEDELITCQGSRRIPAANRNSSSFYLDESCFLYKHPVQVFSNSSDTSDDEHHVEVISYAIVYNLALCHHLRAISENSSSITICEQGSYLKRAIALYKHALKLLMSPHNRKLDMLHTLAIVNNLGHAYHLLHNEATAKRCFQRLLQAIMGLLSENDDQSDLTRDDRTRNHLPLDGFLSNIMSLVMGSSSSAPAA